MYVCICMFVILVLEGRGQKVEFLYFLLYCKFKVGLDYMGRVEGGCGGDILYN